MLEKISPLNENFLSLSNFKQIKHMTHGCQQISWKRVLLLKSIW